MKLSSVLAVLLIISVALPASAMYTTTYVPAYSYPRPVTVYTTYHQPLLPYYNPFLFDPYLYNYEYSQEGAKVAAVSLIASAVILLVAAMMNNKY
jgi:hypothetical protein